MNIYQKTTMGAVPIRIALATLIIATLLMAPTLTQAQVGHGRDTFRMMHTHPIIHIITQWEERHGWLPPGLARLLERYEDLYGPIDDDDDDDDVDNDPELENVDEDVDETTATLQFEFSEDVQARLFVGTESGFGNNDDGVMDYSHNNYDSEHEFILEDLEADTEYFYRVRYRDEDGNTVMSAEMSFTTEEEEDDNGNGDSEEPELENVEENVGVSTTTLKFEFSEDVRVRLFASTESGFSNNDAGVIRESHTNYDSEHEFMLEDLEADTEYFYRVTFRDTDGNTVTSDDMSFVTGEEDESDTTAPEVESLTVEAGTSSAQFQIEFDEPVRVQLWVSEVDGFDEETSDLMTFEETDFLDEHTFEVEDLTPDTEYFYRINYEDEAGNAEEGNQLSFTTDAEEDTTGPVISGISGEAGTTTIIGSFSTNEPARAEIHTSTSTGFSVGDAGVMVTDDVAFKTDHELTITGLTAATTYYHIIVVEDEAGNTTQSEEFTFGTL